MHVFFLLCVALVAACHLAIQSLHRLSLWCITYFWISVMGSTAKPKPPVPPKPVLKSPRKSPQTFSTSPSAVGHNDTSKPSTKDNHETTPKLPASAVEQKRSSSFAKSDKHIVRGESVESTDESCCGNLAYLICHKGPKTVARQVTSKPKPPAKPPKPSLESLARARAARRSIGDEIPAGKEGFKYVDDSSTESSADYKDIVFDSNRNTPPVTNNGPKSSQPGDVNLADWEPLETSSRQSDPIDVFADDAVFHEEMLVDAKTVRFSPPEDLNATFEQPVEAINYSVQNPLTDSKNPVAVRHSWPRRTKKQKIPPERPPPPKNYRQAYGSISDDERNRVELDPEASPILHRSSSLNEETSSLYPSQGSHALTADGRYYCVGEKLSFYPYASSVQSHFTKLDSSSPVRSESPSYANEQVPPSKKNLERINVSDDAVFGPERGSEFNKSRALSPNTIPSENSGRSERLSCSESMIFNPEEILMFGGSKNHAVLPEKRKERWCQSETAVDIVNKRSGSNRQAIPLTLFSRDGKQDNINNSENTLAKNSDTFGNAAGETFSYKSTNDVLLDDSTPLQSKSKEPSEDAAISCSWPRRTKPTPPARPPPPVALFHLHSSADPLSSVHKSINPPHPSLPHFHAKKFEIHPNVPPRTKRKRSRTVEITPSTFQAEAPSRQRSHSLHDDCLPQALTKELALSGCKSLYTAVSKDPERKKKPLAEPQVYDRMRFRPLPAPPPPPRKLSKGKLEMSPQQALSDDDKQTGKHYTDDATSQAGKLSPSSIAAKMNEIFGEKDRKRVERPCVSPELEEYRSELLKRYAEKHSEKKAETSVSNQLADKDNASVKVQLERYETIHNLHTEIDDKGVSNCFDANLNGDDKEYRLFNDSSNDVAAHDIKEQQGKIHDEALSQNVNINNTGNNNSDSAIDKNCHVRSISQSDELKQVSVSEHASHSKSDPGLHKLKKFDDSVKQPEKGSPRLLRREEVLSGYGVLLKEETIPSQTIGEMLAQYKHEMQKKEDICLPPSGEMPSRTLVSEQKPDLPRQESTQSVQSADGDEKEVFAIEVFVSSDAQSTKENSHDTSLEVQSLDSSYCIDENANVPDATKNNRENPVNHDGVKKSQSPKSPSKKLKSKAKRMSQSTFYFPANSEERSRSSSPQRGETGNDSEISGNIADVDSSAGSSGRESAEQDDGKRRSSIFYTDFPEKVEKSVQTVPQEANTKMEDEKSEDTDELMDIARDIKKELSLIIERHRKIQDEVEPGHTLGSHLLARKAVSSTQSSASEISCQGSSAESEDENESAEQKKAKKLFFIAREVMTSEENFVNALKLLNEDFRQVVEDTSKEKGFPIVPDDVLNAIFRFLPQLQNLNQSLLEEIKERIDDWQQSPKIADVLVKVGPFLKLYSCYIRDFETMTTTLDEACRKYPLFGQVVKDFEASPQCHKLALKHYLLKPVQRIPQYRLLLQDYLNHLLPESVDYEDTARALQIVSEVANHANETMKQGDNFLKLMSIQNSLLTSHEIIKPGRVFLKEGELLKLSRKGNQPRWFILFNDSLLYLTPVQQGVFRVNHELPLTGMRVSVPMQNDYQNEFSVFSVTRSFSLAANTTEDREEWITALTRAIEENAVKRSSFINIQMQWKQGSTSYEQSDFILGKQAPVWIPDNRVTMCQLCTTEFTITYRRHHCRACGRVICSQCSANRAFLKYLDRRAARVCDNCFLKLQEEEEASKQKVQLSESESDPTTPLGRHHQGKQKRPRRYLPSVLKEVCANDQGSTISGYLYRLSKKRWKRYWFVLKDKVLYTYKASEDVAAKESIPVLGFTVETFTESVETVDPKLVFQLHHPNQSLFFYAETVGNAERWVKAMKEATVLE